MRWREWEWEPETEINIIDLICYISPLFALDAQVGALSEISMGNWIESNPNSR